VKKGLVTHFSKQNRN